MIRRQPLKRGKGLASGKGLERKQGLNPGSNGLKRSKALYVDPEKVREANERARKRSAENARAPLPKDVREIAFQRSGFKCVKCGAEYKRSWPLHPHHVFPVRSTAAHRAWPELELDPDNVIALCAGCHDAHERWCPRLERRFLPECALNLAVGNTEREVYLERNYPVED